MTAKKNSISHCCSDGGYRVYMAALYATRQKRKTNLLRAPIEEWQPAAIAHRHGLGNKHVGRVGGLAQL